MAIKRKPKCTIIPKTIRNSMLGEALDLPLQYQNSLTIHCLARELEVNRGTILVIVKGAGRQTL